jgi:hypothetical protein
MFNLLKKGFCEFNQLVKDQLGLKSDPSKRVKKNFRKIINELNLEDRFTQIYNINYWNNRESASGRGSTIALTKNLREKLPELFTKFSIKNVFDGPCGDFNWMRLVVEETNINYIGGDIVLPLIQSNQSKYGKHNIRFEKIDLTKDALPTADLMICRDCLFHLSYEDAKLVLSNFIKSDIPYLLTTSYHSNISFENKNIVTGHFRKIDLFSVPYHFPKDVLFEIDDWIAPESPRSMYLWSKVQVIEALQKFQAS